MVAEDFDRQVRFEFDSGLFAAFHICLFGGPERGFN
jgi:hypothetical protein